MPSSIPEPLSTPKLPFSTSQRTGAPTAMLELCFSTYSTVSMIPSGNALSIGMFFSDRYLFHANIFQGTWALFPTQAEELPTTLVSTRAFSLLEQLSCGLLIAERSHTWPNLPATGAYCQVHWSSLLQSSSGRSRTMSRSKRI